MAARDGVKPIPWMRLVRDAPDRPSSAQVGVLVMLALRMRKTGEGFASHDRLAADAGCSVSTAKRATSWARDAGYLEQTRRGHRLTGSGDDAKAVASEWRLTNPTGQRVTRDTLGQQANGSDGHANGSDGHANGSPVTPQEVFTKRSSTKRGDGTVERVGALDAPPQRPPPGDINAQYAYLAALHEWCQDHRSPDDTRPPARLMAVAERMGRLDEPTDYQRINAIGKREDEIHTDLELVAAARAPDPFGVNGQQPEPTNPLAQLRGEQIPDLAALGRRAAEMINDGVQVYAKHMFAMGAELFGPDADVGQGSLDGPLWESFWQHRICPCIDWDPPVPPLGHAVADCPVCEPCWNQDPPLRHAAADCPRQETP